jgi:ketosteroid isomerase-like protein
MGFPVSPRFRRKQVNPLKHCFVLCLLLTATQAGLAARIPLPAVAGRAAQPASFAEEMQKLRDTWVREFNARHAENVAAFYAPEAELMRWDGTVHGHDSILAELQRTIADGAHDYVVHSLHAEQSGDIGYDTGAYNVTLKDRVVEGNYVVVVKRIAGQWKIVAHASIPNPRTRF